MTGEAAAARRTAMTGSRNKRDAGGTDEAEMDHLMTKLKHKQSEK